MLRHLLPAALLICAPLRAQSADPAPRLALRPPDVAGVERLSAVFPGGRALGPARSPAAIDALFERLDARLEVAGCSIELALLDGALLLDLTCPPGATVEALEQLTPLLAAAPAAGPELELALSRANRGRELAALQRFARLERGLLGLIYDDRLPLGLARSKAQLSALDDETLADLAGRLVSRTEASVRLSTALDPSVAQLLLDGFASDLPAATAPPRAPSARPAPGPVDAGPAGEPWRLYRDPQPLPEAALLDVLVEGAAPADDPATLAALGAWLEWIACAEGPLGSQLQDGERASYRLGELELGRPAFQLRLELTPDDLDARCAALLGPLASPDLALPTAEALERALEARRSGDRQGARLGLDPLLATLVVEAAGPTPAALAPESARLAGLTWCAPDELWLAAESASEPAEGAALLFVTPWERTGPEARAALAAMFTALGGEEPFRELKRTATRADVTISLPDGELQLQLDTERRFDPFGHRLEQTQAGRRIVMRIVRGRADREIEGAGELRPEAEMWQLVGAEERGLQRLLFGLAQRGPVGARLLRPADAAPAPATPTSEDAAPDPAAPESSAPDPPPGPPPSAHPATPRATPPGSALPALTAAPSQEPPPTIRGDDQEARTTPSTAPDAPAPATDEPPAEPSPLPARLELFDARGPLAVLEIDAEGLPASLVPDQPGPRREYRYASYSESIPRLPLRTELIGSRVTEVRELRIDPELADERFEPRR